MRQSHGRRPSSRMTTPHWSPSVADGGWALRLRFACIAIAFALCCWVGLRTVSGRISFAWLAPLQKQTQALTAPLRNSARGNAFPTVGNTQSPLAHPLVSAQPVPTVTARPATAVRVVVLAPTVRPAPTSSPTAQSARIPVVVMPPALPTLAETAIADATVTPDQTARPTATAGIELATGPHTIYVVHAGDTIYGIARRYGISASLLAAFNHLTPPYTIIAGRRLLIPAV